MSDHLRARLFGFLPGKRCRGGRALALLNSSALCGNKESGKIKICRVECPQMYSDGKAR